MDKMKYPDGRDFFAPFVPIIPVNPFLGNPGIVGREIEVD